MDKSDREWVYAGVGCVVAGAIVSIISGKQRWFAMGGVAGAALVGYRYFSRLETMGAGRAPPSYIKHVLKAKPDFDRLGAPDIPATETQNVGAQPEHVTEYGAEGYPMAFRVPDTEIHIDTMDDRIRPHFVGPLGPENDPVRYW